MLPTRALTVTAVLALLVASLQPAWADVGDAAKGETLARTLCADCHLNPAQGEKQGPMGVPGFVAVANRPLQTAEGVVEWLESIPPMMPNHHLTQDEMYDLAAFIMSLRKEPTN
ncbi:Cytochrome c [Hyphomicrobium sp. 1Nfss2.1]|uniref:c-type cytochrome n=1 Tax=Hyphomicrobium sp. 1Nfss2.1 TaxID=3413936 RepID=UPI003C7DBFF6